MSIRARVTSEPIDATALLGDIGTDHDGAVLLFLGTVRDHADGRDVRGLVYESYEPMAETVLAEIAAGAAASADEDGRGISELVVVHRVGELGIGEVSVAIAVASAHRAEAYDASRAVIEAIKQRLPVWKKELYVDGAADWVEGEDPRASTGPARVGELSAPSRASEGTS